jgi:hypothetical protein
MKNNTEDEKKLRDQRAELNAKMGAGGNLLKGSLIERFTVCTKSGCRCARGHKHGPYLYVSIFDGKRSRQVYVPKRMQQEVRSWVKNYENTKRLIDKISARSIDLIKLTRHDKSS